MDRQVQGLIAELRALRLREERVIERLEEANWGNEAAQIQEGRPCVHKEQGSEARQEH
jgi:hypothetical protein